MTRRPIAVSAATVLVAAMTAGLSSPAVRAAPSAAETPVDLSPVKEVRGRSTLPEGWQHGAFIEIFVRGFQDSDGDGIGDACDSDNDNDGGCLRKRGCYEWQV